MDRQRIKRLAAEVGALPITDPTLSVSGIYANAETYLSGPDQSRSLREAVENVRNEILNEVHGDLVMWLHDMDFENCPCQQCGYLRADIERVRRMHG